MLMLLKERSGLLTKHKAIILVLIAMALICFVSNEIAYAGNATRMLGFGARDSGMGGATTASSEDTSCLIRNPAGLVNLGNRIDVEYLNIIPHDITMDTEGQAIPPVPVSLSNVGRKQESTVT